LRGVTRVGAGMNIVKQRGARGPLPSEEGMCRKYVRPSLKTTLKRQINFRQQKACYLSAAYCPKKIRQA
jgi:hypothetical protein